MRVASPSSPTAAVGPGSFLTNLQNERNRASIDLIGLGAATTLPVDNNEEARKATDASLVELRAVLDGSGASEVADAFAPALAALDDLAAVRADVDAYNGPLDTTNRDFADEVFTRYTTMTEAFFDSVSAVSLAIDDADLRNGSEIVDAATRQSEMRARIVRDVVFATIGGTIDSSRSARSWPPSGTDRRASMTTSAPTPPGRTRALRTRRSPIRVWWRSTGSSNAYLARRRDRDHAAARLGSHGARHGYTGLRATAADRARRRGRRGRRRRRRPGSGSSSRSPSASS